MSDRGLIDALHRHVDGEELSSAEETAVKLHAFRLLEMWEWQHGELQAGTLPRERLPVEAWRLYYHEKPTPNAVADVWELRKPTLTPDFVRFMEENVVNER